MAEVRDATATHADELAADLHDMGGNPVADAEPQPAVDRIVTGEPLVDADRQRRMEAFKEKYGYEPGVKSEAKPEAPIDGFPSIEKDPLSRAVDNLFEERGDFTVYQGKDANGSEIHTSAKELVQNAREELTRTQEMEEVYQRAAACMGIGV